MNTQAHITLSFSEKSSEWIKDDADLQILKDKITYHQRSGVLTKDGVKTLHLPIETDGVICVPLSFFKDAFGYVTEFDNGSNSAKIGEITVFADSKTISAGGKNVVLSVEPFQKNDTLYVPLKDFCLNVLKKKVFYDTSSHGGGMFLISDNEIIIPEGYNIQVLNDYALYERPDMTKIKFDFEKSGYAGVHPRIMADASDFARIRSMAETDENMKKWADDVIKSADEFVKDPNPLIYELRDNIRLWYVSNDFIRRISTLAMAYQLTDDKEYSDRAWLEMESVANFPSWHPEHSIDVGAMAIGYAIGYDWLYNTYTEEQLKIIEDGVLKNGFYIYIEGFQGRHERMIHALFELGNHCMVMESGAAMMGIAFFDVFPEYSAYCTSASVRGLEYGLSQYDPTGSWFEGIGYASMTLYYLTYQLSTLKRIFGHTYSLDKADGLENVLSYFLHIQSPQGAFGFQDCSNQNITSEEGLIWLGNHFGDYENLSAFWNLYGFEGDYRALVWYNPDVFCEPKTLPLDSFFADQQVLTVRDSWDKEIQQTFAGIKGGTAGGLYIGHGHMDMGTFSFYANNVQWTIDIGAENFNVPGFWSGEQIDSPRWQYYRQRAEGHNCFIVAPDKNSEYDLGYVSFTRYESKPQGALCAMDMTDVNYGKAKKAKRGMYFADQRKSLVIRDEVMPAKECTMYWFMHTLQDVEVLEDRKTVILKEKGNPTNYVTLDFVCNEDFEVSIMPAIPLPTSPHPDGMTDDSDIQKVAVKIVSGNMVELTAKLTPCTVDGTHVSDFHIPIDSWEVIDDDI